MLPREDSPEEDSPEEDSPEEDSPEGNSLEEDSPVDFLFSLDFIVSLYEESASERGEVCIQKK